MTPVSIQLYSVRDDCVADLKGTLKKLKEYGYDGVEPYTMFDLSAEEFRGMLDEVGLECTSFHTGYEVYRDNGIEETCAERIAMGCKVVAFPYLLMGVRPGEEDYEKTRPDYQKIADIYAEHGIKLLFHNHEGDAYKLTPDAKAPMMDLLFAENPILPEADTAWLIAAGVDPVDFFKKYETPAIHIKDITYNGMIPERICKVVGREYVWNDDAPCNFEFRTLGQGLHDVPRTIRAAVASGVKHIIVEQDLPTPGLTAMECAKRNIEYLRTFEF